MIKPITSGVLNAIDYGVIGGNFGKTYPDSTINFKSFFDEVKYKNKAGYIPNEWYYVNDTIYSTFDLYASKRGLSIKGDSADNTRILFYPSTNKTAIELFDSQTIIEKISINGDDSNKIAKGFQCGSIYPKEAFQIMFRDVNISNMDIGIDIFQAFIISLENCYFYGNNTAIKIWGNIINVRGGEIAKSKIGIHFPQKGENIQAYQNEANIDGVCFESNEVGIKISHAKRSVNINGCYFEGNGYDLLVGTEDGDYVDTVNINGGSFSNGTKAIFDKVRAVNIKGVNEKDMIDWTFSPKIKTNRY